MTRIHYGKETELIWRRVKSGDGFRFVNESGKPIPKVAKERLQALTIPPAWEEVHVSPDPLGYIQATGVDAKGRTQYIYHPEWIRQNQEHKFDQMVSFGERLPTLREVVRAHMNERGLTRDRLLATVVWLLEHTFIRVGNKTYADDNKSYGLTTMREKHVDVSGNTITFSFKGKSGVFHELEVTHPRVAQTIRACIELPGYELFQYKDENDERRVIDSAEVNEYLQKHTGADFSAKDFRTWGGSVMAGGSLYEIGPAASEEEFKKNVLEAVTLVSENLGNTKKVCRTYYIHPIIIESYEKQKLIPHFEKIYSGKKAKKSALRRDEYAVWSLIKNS